MILNSYRDKPLDIVDVNEVKLEHIEDMAKNSVYSEKEQGRKVVIIKFSQIKFIKYIQLKSLTEKKIDKVNFVMNDLQEQVDELKRLIENAESDFDKKYKSVVCEMYPEVLDPDFNPKKKKSKVILN